jgi:dihydrofolate reductase
MKAYVFSHMLRQRDCPDATVSDNPKETVTALKQQKGKDIWLFGGGQLFRSLLDLELVDAVEIGLVPVLLGGGLPMLPNPAKLAKLKFTKHRIYEKTGTVLLTYAVM